MKIKCAFCKNELDKRCTVKKTTIKPNKDRKCNDYSFDVQRELDRLEGTARTLDRRDRDRQAKQTKRVDPYTNPDILSRFRSNVAE